MCIRDSSKADQSGLTTGKGTPMPMDPTYLHRKAIDKTASALNPFKKEPETPGGDTPPPVIEPGDKVNLGKSGRGKLKRLLKPGKKQFPSTLKNSYEFQVDVNENIIGATFAKGDNQGNFNNEVNAVRDALAQIQELSPQTISSYQKKAGKQYRQAKGERPMHPEYAEGLNAAGKMTDKDMDDSDKAYDIMKKRGKGLAMSKGKGVQKEGAMKRLATDAAEKKRLLKIKTNKPINVRHNCFDVRCVKCEYTD